MKWLLVLVIAACLTPANATSPGPLSLDESLFELCYVYVDDDQPQPSCLAFSAEIPACSMHCDTYTLEKRLLLALRLRPDLVVPLATNIRLVLEGAAAKQGRSHTTGSRAYTWAIRLLAVHGALKSLEGVKENLSELDLAIVRDLISSGFIHPNTLSSLIETKGFACWLREAPESAALMGKRRFRNFAFERLFIELDRAGGWCSIGEISRHWPLLSKKQQARYARWLLDWLVQNAADFPRGKGFRLDFVLAAALQADSFTDDPQLVEQLLAMGMAFDRLDVDWRVRRRAVEAGTMIGGIPGQDQDADVAGMVSTSAPEPADLACRGHANWMELIPYLNRKEIEAMLEAGEDRLCLEELGIGEQPFLVEVVAALRASPTYRKDPSLRFRALRLIAHPLSEALKADARRVYRELQPVQQVTFAATFPELIDPVRVRSSIRSVFKTRNPYTQTATMWNAAWSCLHYRPKIDHPITDAAGIFRSNVCAMDGCELFEVLRESLLAVEPELSADSSMRCELREASTPFIIRESASPTYLHSTAADTLPLISIDYDIGDLGTEVIRLLVNEIDVSGEARVTDSQINYTPRAPLAEGTQYVEFRLGTLVHKWSFRTETNPRVTIIEPESKSKLAHGEKLHIRAEFSDVGSGIDPGKTQVYVDGHRQPRENLAHLATVSESTLDLMLAEPLRDGRNTVEIRVFDKAGNWGSHSRRFQVGLAPEVLEFYPAPGEILPSGTQQVTVRIRFNSGDYDLSSYDFEVPFDPAHAPTFVEHSDGSYTVSYRYVTHRATQRCFGIEIWNERYLKTTQHGCFRVGEAAR